MRAPQSDEAFVNLLIELINPNISDADLAALVTGLDAELARDALVALAAHHSGCVENQASCRDVLISTVLLEEWVRFRENMRRLREEDSR
jgi:hypothetical protein